MRFIVCIKQVPGNADVKMDLETNTIISEGVEFILNPFDMYAVEEAIRMKEKLGGTVTALTMGSPQAEAVLREAISIGADEGILVTDDAFAGSDTWVTSYTLALAIKKIGEFDVILFGKQAYDGDTAQVGPGVAAHLDLPQVTYVRKIEEIDDKHIVAERLMETGFEVVESPLPCIITCVKELNEPRLPSLKGKMAAKKASVTTWTAADIEAGADKLGLGGSRTKIVKFYTPAPREGGEMIEGEPEEIAPKLAEKLKDIVLSAGA